MEYADTQAGGLNKRRSDRVVLRVPIVLSMGMPDGMIVREEVFTKVVNAHGGLLIAETEIMAGRKIVLTNPKIKLERQCRVVRCERANSHEFAIAFEFVQPSPNFWPVAFPPANWEKQTANLSSD
jgi:hypothetical protein